MNKQSFNDLFTKKEEQLRSVVNTLRTNEGLSKNTRQNMVFHKQRELKVLRLIRGLIEHGLENLDEQDSGVLLTLLNTESQQHGVTVTFEVGESIMSILQRYRDVKNLLPRMNKYAATHGMIVDFVSGTIKAGKGE